MNDAHKRRVTGWIGRLAFTLVVLYPLSFGAGDCIYIRSGPQMQAALSALYYPVNRLCEKSKIAARFRDWNVLFWHRLADGHR